MEDKRSDFRGLELPTVKHVSAGASRIRDLEPDTERVKGKAK